MDATHEIPPSILERAEQMQKEYRAMTPKREAGDR